MSRFRLWLIRLLAGQWAIVVSDSITVRGTISVRGPAAIAGIKVIGGHLNLETEEGPE